LMGWMRVALTMYCSSDKGRHTWIGRRCEMRQAFGQMVQKADIRADRETGRQAVGTYGHMHGA
jgi:hypothetical protein